MPSVVKLVWIDCTETFLTTDGSGMGTGWDQDIGLLHLILIGSVKCSLTAQWAPAAVTPAPAAAGLGATPEA